MARIDQSLVDFGIGFEDGRQVPACGPGYGIEQDHEETPLDLAADMLAKIFTEIIPASGQIKLDLVGQKFTALHFLLNRNGTATMTSIAERAGVSKQCLDHHVNLLAKKLNFHGFNQKKESARPNYAEAQRAVWANLTEEQRRQRRAGKTAQSAPPAAQFDNFAGNNENIPHRRGTLPRPQYSTEQAQHGP